MTKTKRNANARYEAAKKLVRGSKLVMIKFYDRTATGRALKISWSLWGGVNVKTGQKAIRRYRRQLTALADSVEFNAGSGYRSFTKDVFVFVGATSSKGAK